MWRRFSARLDLLKKILASNDHKKLAKTTVRELAAFYKFRNVSIFTSQRTARILQPTAQQELGPKEVVRSC